MIDAIDDQKVNEMTKCESEDVHWARVKTCSKFGKINLGTRTVDIKDTHYMECRLYPHMNVTHVFETKFIDWSMGRLRSFLWGGVTSTGVYLGAKYAIDQRSLSLRQLIYDMHLDLPNATHLPVRPGQSCCVRKPTDGLWFAPLDSLAAKISSQELNVIIEFQGRACDVYESSHEMERHVVSASGYCHAVDPTLIAFKQKWNLVHHEMKHNILLHHLLRSLSLLFFEV